MTRLQLGNFGDAVRTLEAQRVLQRYGPGLRGEEYRYRVEFIIDSPQNGNGSSAGTDLSQQRLIVETVPLHSNPHGVGTFLKQITTKLWNGSSFSEKPSRGFLAIPLSKDPNDKSRSLSKFAVPIITEEASTSRILGSMLSFVQTGSPEILIEVNSGGRQHNDNMAPFATIMEGENIFRDMYDMKRHDIQQPVIVHSAKMLSRLTIDELSNNLSIL